MNLVSSYFFCTLYGDEHWNLQGVPHENGYQNIRLILVNMAAIFINGELNRGTENKTRTKSERCVVEFHDN